MVVTVMEKWNDKYYITGYLFSNEQDKQEFLKLCKDSNCLVLENNKIKVS